MKREKCVCVCLKENNGSTIRALLCVFRYAPLKITTNTLLLSTSRSKLIQFNLTSIVKPVPVHCIVSDCDSHNASLIHNHNTDNEIKLFRWRISVSVSGSEDELEFPGGSIQKVLFGTFEVRDNSEIL